MLAGWPATSVAKIFFSRSGSVLQFNLSLAGFLTSLLSSTNSSQTLQSFFRWDVEFDLFGSGALSCVILGSGLDVACENVEAEPVAEVEDDADFLPPQLLQVHSLNLFLPLTVSGRSVRHTEHGG